MIKNKLKIILSLLIFIIFTNGFTNVFAVEYPSSFWTINNKFTAVMNTENYNDIINYGTQEISILLSLPDYDETRNLIVSRYDSVGRAYVHLGDYNGAYNIYSELYNYISKYGDEFHDYLVVSRARIKQYSPKITLYTDDGASTNFYSKNEKENGVLFGVCETGETASKLQNESLVLIYQELTESLSQYNKGTIKTAASKGRAVEYALNCPNQGADIKSINNYSKKLQELSDFFNQYSNTKIYLRFAAEFDIWGNKATPNEFISAFRYVSNFFKTRNSNVAMVWSVNHASDYDIDIEDYYPGDNYVDWVGISLYAQKYHGGKKNSEDEHNVVYQNGDNSDPVIAIQSIVEKYGNKKPIMIAESGCGHTLIGSNENLKPFALRRLKEYMYYIPMVYPQVKAMAYFDFHVNSSSEKYDYRLSNNSEMQDEYIKATKSQRFIQDNYNNETSFCYRAVGYGTTVQSVFPIACYAHKYGADLAEVTYFIDNNIVGYSKQVPFETLIDASGYNGWHKLKAVASFSNGETLVTEQNVVIDNSSSNIKVEISGKRINFDQNPIIYNSRTMVPMRKIFEVLGADVEWNSSTKTVTGQKGDRTIKVTVGSNKMYVNHKEITLDTPPLILSDRTLVPVRAIAEGLGCDVDWDNYSRLVSIEPKVFKWSSWDEDLPSSVNNDLFYIEKKTQYRHCEKIYKQSSDYYLSGWHQYDKQISSYSNEIGPVYNDPSNGERKVRSEDYVSSSNYKNIYHYFRYADSLHANWGASFPAYSTLFRWDLDYELENSSLGKDCYKLPCDCGIEDDYHTVYSVNWRLEEEYITREKVSDNYATRWYYQEPNYTYYYWKWSNYYDWEDEYPYYLDDDEILVDERTVYRYKEK